MHPAVISLWITVTSRVEQVVVHGQHSAYAIVLLRIVILRRPAVPGHKTSLVKRVHELRHLCIGRLFGCAEQLCGSHLGGEDAHDLHGVPPLFHEADQSFHVPFRDQRLGLFHRFQPLLYGRFPEIVPQPSEAADECRTFDPPPDAADRSTQSANGSCSHAILFHRPGLLLRCAAPRVSGRCPRARSVRSIRASARRVRRRIRRR